MGGGGGGGAHPGRAKGGVSDPSLPGVHRDLRSQACIYCGRQPAGSVDHVPPRCFFPPPLPSDLITLPSCPPCNVQFSREDQYAHSVITMRRDVQAQPRLQRIHERLLRSLDRPQANAFRTMLAGAVRHGPVLLDSGLWLPDQDYVLVDRRRLRRWAARLVRGLYAHETGRPAGDELRVQATLGEDHPEILRTAVSWLAGQPLRSAGKGVIEYKWMSIPDELRASLWCIELYRVMPVLGFIGPFGEHEA